MTTGKLVELKDLFEPNSQYVKILSEIIDKKIAEWEVPVLEEFKEIRMDQYFYLADHNYCYLFSSL
ncbi:hypothetical protein [Psychrobacillus sp. FJAT-51614]|uniref:hypothetical protein n=1 Tax=Psychrobacillus mangrovi TaxID=3117745 RepID=UPI003013E0D7